MLFLSHRGQSGPEVRLKGSGGSTEVASYSHRCPLHAGSCCGPEFQTGAGITGPEAEQRSWPPSRPYSGVLILVRSHLIAVHGGPVQVKLLSTWRPGRRWMGWLRRKPIRAARKLPRACGASSPSPGSAPSSAQVTSTSWRPTGAARAAAWCRHAKSACLTCLVVSTVATSWRAMPVLGGKHRCLHALPAPAWQHQQPHRPS